MLPLDRKNLIIEYLKEHGSARVEELATTLNVTPMTIRRDLQYLEDNNIATRTFGGAVFKTSMTDEVSYKDKIIVNKDQKKRIAKYAASLVQDGQIVLLDSGTTNMEIAKLLKSKLNLTIVTTDIKIAGLLASSTDFQILCTGGTIQNSTGACLGSFTVEFLKSINADIGFLGASSINIENGMSTPTLQKSDVKKQIMKSVKTSILAVDSSKFGKKSFAKVCDIDEFDLIITDIDLSKSTYNIFKKQNVNITLV